MKKEMNKLQKQISSLQASLKKAADSLQVDPSPRQLTRKVFHRDYRAQYNKLAEIIANTDPSKIEPVLLNIIKEGEYYEGSVILKFSVIWKFNPVVIGYLKTLLEINGDKKI